MHTETTPEEDAVPRQELHARPESHRLMRAAIHTAYGPPEAALQLQQLPRPSAGPGEVLVRVTASSVNPADLYRTTGRPWVGRIGGGLRRPSRPVPGVDLAGVVDDVGDGVTTFAPGDAVFGWVRGGAYAEYAVVPADQLTIRPAEITDVQAGAVAIAGMTALQGLRDHGKVTDGTRVLINGASGGVGTFAVQIARALGAHVTAVCSTRNVEQAERLGADRVVDYRTQDLSVLADGSVDVLFDVASSIPSAEVGRLLSPRGRRVIVGGNVERNRVIGPLGPTLRALLRFALSKRRVVVFVSTENLPDLEELARLMADGAVTPVVEHTWPLTQLVDAIDEIGGGRARAKLGITI
ncbi:NAD(P)-dependent alcohol dehydrogenase [Euzebya tangerina]|uniref:NAD(P)-dependent alcohol dehydrogenase n=1 Tax=Euzebya tangerina TaxID=591198 RepID=UPI0013C31106|nr:NAD(P)-dependent alcohol dehydrogenase [Euzebya tangerina]